MPRFTIRVDERTGVTCFPKEIRKEGFIGEVEGLPNARTFTLVRPGTKLRDVAKSLKLVLAEVSHRMEMGEIRN